MTKFKNFIYSFKNIFIYLLLTIIVSGLLYRINIKGLYLNLITTIIILIVLILLNLDIFKNKFSDLKKNFKKYIFIMLENWCFGTAIMIITNVLITNITGNIAINESLNRENIDNYILLSFITIVLLTPIIEEISFRASFKSLFKNKYLFCLFTSIIFGLFHVIFSGDYIFIIPYAAAGFFLAKTYFETDNIYTSIIAHSFHNFLTIIIILLGGIF